MEEYLPQEWSDSGKRLLETIQKIIKEQGGVEQMHKLVMLELHPNRYQRDKIILEYRYKLVHGKVKMKDIPEILGITETEFKKLKQEVNESENEKY
ncbi:MAG: hypothetical protein Q8R83_06155 [Legionellaceae bacterium]|nr:hypothetical protein [Legionellaceae bacterium]